MIIWKVDNKLLVEIANQYFGLIVTCNTLGELGNVSWIGDACWHVNILLNLQPPIFHSNKMEIHFIINSALNVSCIQTANLNLNYESFWEP